MPSTEACRERERAPSEGVQRPGPATSWLLAVMHCSSPALCCHPVATRSSSTSARLLGRSGKATTTATMTATRSPLPSGFDVVIQRQLLVHLSDGRGAVSWKPAGRRDLAFVPSLAAATTGPAIWSRQKFLISAAQGRTHRCQAVLHSLTISQVRSFARSTARRHARLGLSTNTLALARRRLLCVKNLTAAVSSLRLRQGTMADCFLRRK